MWRTQVDLLDNGRAKRIRLTLDGSVLTYEQTIAGWCSDVEFRSAYIAMLQDEGFAEYRLETPPVTLSTISRPFEQILLAASGLDRAASPTAFNDQISTAGGTTVIAFPNLGNDAVLVVPCPIGNANAYAHLAAFIRCAPAEQKHALWRVVGEAVKSRLSEKPLWLSTAGLGVPWLHVRLDSRPKYYGFDEYCRWP